MFICEKCGCSDKRYFGIRKGSYYCRRCITFNGEKAIQITNLNRDLTEKLDFQLSEEQEEISIKIKESIANGKDVLLYAVCGAGKTELVYKAIAHQLQNGKQIGFCIPRRDVVIELEPRIKSAFPDVVITTVYGGNTSNLVGDIILLTSHQLYRYKNYFDLLIIDETDAFPYSNNETLMNFFEKSIRGNYIMMSATPLEWMIDKIRKNKGVFLTLQKRYHGHPLIVPKVVIFPFFQFIYVIYKVEKFIKENKPCFIFCPTIYEAEEIYRVVTFFIKGGNYVHSKRQDREKIIDDFKKGKYKYLVTTSVLERGVTVKNIQVIIVHADSAIYNSATLIQIAGRVGRKIDAFDGEVIFLCNKRNIEVETSIKKIEEANKYVDM